MFPIATVNDVARKAASSDKPIWGRKIAGRRAELDKSLTDIENETDSVIYQQLLYRIENGRKDPMTMTITQFNALLTALQWTPGQFAEATKLPISIVVADEALKTLAEQIPSQIKTVPSYRLTVPREGKGELVRLDDEPIMLEAELEGEFELYRVRTEKRHYVFVVRREGEPEAGATIFYQVGDEMRVAVVRAIEDGRLILEDLYGRVYSALHREIKVRGVVEVEYKRRTKPGVN